MRLTDIEDKADTNLNFTVPNKKKKNNSMMPRAQTCMDQICSKPPHTLLALCHDRNLKCTLALQTPWLCLPLPSPPPPPPPPPPVCTALPAHSTPLSSSLLSVEAFEIRLSKMLLFELMKHFLPGVVGWGWLGGRGDWRVWGTNKYRLPLLIHLLLPEPNPPPLHYQSHHAMQQPPQPPSIALHLQP